MTAEIDLQLTTDDALHQLGPWLAGGKGRSAQEPAALEPQVSPGSTLSELSHCNDAPTLREKTELPAG